MIRHSIKWRLQLWHGFLLTLMVTGLTAGFYEFERRTLLEAVDAELREVLTPLLPRFNPLRGPGRPEPLPPERDPRPTPPSEIPRFRQPPPEDFQPAIPFEVDPIRDGRIYLVAWTRPGQRMAATTNAPADLVQPRRPPPLGVTRTRSRGANRELIQRLPAGRCVLVGTSLEPVQRQLRQLAVGLVAVGITIVAVGLTVGWWLASRSLRPIADIGRAAQEIAAGDLSKRINAADTESELGHLIAVLNSTFARLETAFAQQKQFTSDAAHELRTPVSIMLTQVQSALQRDRTEAEYRETLEACQRAAQRMKRLIESLLQLARFDAGQEPLQRVSFDLAEKVRDCLDLVQPLTEERGIRILNDLAAVGCQGDPDRIGQVITNLLTNAVNYNRPGGEVRVATAPNGARAVLTVSDTGMGIAADDAPNVFKRFYRADKSRASGTAHSGLGLAICQCIVTAHGGTLDFTSEPGRGTTFTLRLPARTNDERGSHQRPVLP